jgi:hypothetical protein
MCLKLSQESGESFFHISEMTFLISYLFLFSEPPEGMFLLPSDCLFIYTPYPSVGPSSSNLFREFIIETERSQHF